MGAAQGHNGSHSISAEGPEFGSVVLLPASQAQGPEFNSLVKTRALRHLEGVRCSCRGGGNATLLGGHVLLLKMTLSSVEDGGQGANGRQKHQGGTDYPSPEEKRGGLERKARGPKEEKLETRKLQDK